MRASFDRADALVVVARLPSADSPFAVTLLVSSTFDIAPSLHMSLLLVLQGPFRK